jgi:alpha-tubulin suppressor-like RCC1 family protein
MGLVSWSCSDTEPLPSTATARQAAISDGAHDGNLAFYFLPPLVPAPDTIGIFDDSLAPVVEICELDSDTGACTPRLAFDTVGSEGSEQIRVDVDAEHYIVNWHTDTTDLVLGGTYRIRVLVNDFELGFADVVVGASNRDLKNLNTDEVIGLVDGRTLPIKFRIERETRFVLGPDGGTVITPDGAVALEVPAGAVQEDVEITVTPVTTPPPDTGVLPGALYDFGPDGLVFDAPTRLTIAYDPAALPAGTDESELVMLGSEDGAWWSEILTSVVDTDAHTVSALIPGFSLYAASFGAHTAEMVPSAAEMLTGDSLHLSFVVKDAYGNRLVNRTTTWRSLDTAVAGVSGTGVVTAYSPGFTVVTAQTSDATTDSGRIGASATISVTNCGNGVIDDGEECDGSNLGGSSCVLQGFTEGALVCAEDCTFDTTDCHVRDVAITGFDLPDALHTCAENPSSVIVVNNGDVPASFSLEVVRKTAVRDDDNQPVTLYETLAVIDVTDLAPDGQPHSLPFDFYLDDIDPYWRRFRHEVRATLLTPDGDASNDDFGWVEIAARWADNRAVLTVPPLTYGEPYQISADFHNDAFHEAASSLMKVWEAGELIHEETITLPESSYTSRLFSRDAVCDTGPIVFEMELSADPWECNLDNNSRVVTRSVAFADLDVTTVDAPAEFAIGETFPVVIGGQNAGDTTALDVSLGLYLNGWLVESFDYDQLTAGSAVTETVEVRLTEVGPNTIEARFSPNTRDPSPENDALAVEVNGLCPYADCSKSFTRIAAGHEHTCGLTPDGSVYCWGRDEQGEIGDGAGSREECGLYQVPCVSSPVPTDLTAVSSGAVVWDLFAGGYNTCGILDTGETYCWGADAVGQLGDGWGAADVCGDDAEACTLTPVPIDTENVAVSAVFLTLSPAGGHTCGLASDQSIYCWGSRYLFRLGAGSDAQATYDVCTSAECHAPVPVVPTFYGERDFEQVATAWDATCGLTTDGEVFCWGSNSQHQLGLEPYRDSAYETVCFVSYTNSPGWCRVPIPLFTTHTFSQITGGAQHFCGIDRTSDEVYCWGINTFGQLGSTTLGGASVPTLVDTSGLAVDSRFKTVSAGWHHTCGITFDDVLLCWGQDYSGQLGDGPEINTTHLPVPVDVSALPAETVFVQVVAGYEHTCGLTSDGDTYCWGSDFVGQIGNGLTETEECSYLPCSTTPQLVDMSSVMPPPNYECGDGIQQGDELCDHAGESATCDVDCTFVACGDGIVNGAAGEACDLDDLAGLSCADVGDFDGGTLACNADCASFDTSGCNPATPIHDLALTSLRIPSAPELESGQFLEIYVEVTNLGNVPETYRVEWRAESVEWGLSAGGSAIDHDLAPGATSTEFFFGWWVGPYSDTGLWEIDAWVQRLDEEVDVDTSNDALTQTYYIPECATGFAVCDAYSGCVDLAAGGLTVCEPGSGCVDLLSDPDYCGTCDTVCAESEVCDGGTCLP